MVDRIDDTTEGFVYFLMEKNELLNASLEKLRVLAGSSSDVYEAAPSSGLVIPGADFAVFISTEADFPAALPSVIDPIISAAPIYSNHALTFGPATPVVTGAAGDCVNIGVCPFTRIDVAE